MKTSQKALEIIESIINAIHEECKRDRQRCLRQLSITLKEVKEVFEVLKREGK